MDMAMLFVIVATTAYGTMENILRGLLTGLTLYLSTAIAGTFYAVLTPYSRSFLNLLANVNLASPPVGGVDTSALAFSFAFAALLLWIILEGLFRAALPDTHLPFLGPLDRVGGALIYLFIGIVLAALLFSVVGYGVAGRAAHDAAALRPEFNQVMDLIQQAQSVWYAGQPPAVYAYD